MEVDDFKSVKRKGNNNSKNSQKPTKIPKKNLDPTLTRSQTVKKPTSTKSDKLNDSSNLPLDPDPVNSTDPSNERQDPLTSRPKPIEAKVSLQALQNYIKSSNSAISLSEVSLNPFIKESCKHVRIQCTSLEIKEKIIKLLTSHQIPYFTFTEKSDKSVVYVLNGYDITSDPESILEDLKDHRIPATKVTTIVKSSESRKAVHLVHFQKDAININLLNHQHKNVYGAKVRWEIRTRSNNNKKLTQCHNCQRWGHSSLRCTFPARCVKCDINHATTSCTRIRSDEVPPKCVNCGGDHTANYSKCPEAIKYSQRTHPKPKIQSSHQIPSRNLSTHNSNAWASHTNYNQNFPNTLNYNPTQPVQTSTMCCCCNKILPASVQHRIEVAKNSPDLSSNSSQNINTKSSPKENSSEPVRENHSDPVKDILVSLAPMLSLPPNKLEVLLKVILKLTDLISGSQFPSQLFEHLFQTPISNFSSGESEKLIEASSSLKNHNGA